MTTGDACDVDGGAFNGRQIIPEAVVADIRRGADRARFATAGYSTLPGFSYRNMWWATHNEHQAFLARGIHGQSLYVDPVADIVIARFASFPLPANRHNDPLTLRAGYAHNTQPITAANVTFNILAPGVVTDHVGGGFSYGLNRNSAIDFALLYAPRVGVSGAEVTPYGPTPGSNINISMSQLVVTLGYTHHFDAPPVQIAKY